MGEVAVDLATAPLHLFRELVHGHGAVGRVDQIKEFLLAGVDAGFKKRDHLSSDLATEAVEILEVVVGDVPEAGWEGGDDVEIDLRIEQVLHGEELKADREHELAGRYADLPRFALQPMERNGVGGTAGGGKDDVYTAVGHQHGRFFFAGRVGQHPQAFHKGGKLRGGLDDLVNEAGHHPYRREFAIFIEQIPPCRAGFCIHLLVDNYYLCAHDISYSIVRRPGTSAKSKRH